MGTDGHFFPPRRFFLSDFKILMKSYASMKALPRLLTLLCVSSSLSYAQDHQEKLVEGGVSPVGDANMITVLGTPPQPSERLVRELIPYLGLVNEVVATFQIGKYEVTWDEWQQVRTWAVKNGYSDLANVGVGSGGNHPVQSVNWYDVLKWCNAKSQKEGLTPVYQLSGEVYKTGESVPTENSSANGYRLPLEKEWEWAARGGLCSKGYIYSGSNDIYLVAWFEVNSGNGTKSVGTKAANELGIFDMSGNVFEWCWDANPSHSHRPIRGGSWSSIAEHCAVDYGTLGIPTLRIPDSGIIRNFNLGGLRLARNSGK
jgi:hypothetical protein